MKNATTLREEIVEGFNSATRRIESFTIPFLNKQLVTDKSVKAYRQEAVIIGVIGMVLTLIGGYEFTVHNLFGYMVKSTGIHWTTVTLMCFQFAVVSLIIERYGIKRLQNLIYSFILAWGFSNTTFEWIYVPLYEAIHLKGFYITLPFLYGRPFGAYWVLIRNGIWLIVGIILISVILKGNKVKIVPSKKWILPVTLTIFFWLAWVFYPFQFQIVQGNLFPQTLYMIPVDATQILGDYMPLYVENFGVHTLNLLAKVFQFSALTVIFTSLKLNNLIRNG